jgi:hypothetical protein
MVRSSAGTICLVRTTSYVAATTRRSRGEAIASNRFDWPKYEDFQVLDANDTVVGEVRVKPNKLLWRDKGMHSWQGVTLEQFAAFAKSNGKKQSK